MDQVIPADVVAIVLGAMFGWCIAVDLHKEIDSFLLGVRLFVRFIWRKIRRKPID